jgi:hypothetical protein
MSTQSISHPDLAADRLLGAQAIATFLGLTPRQVRLRPETERAVCRRVDDLAAETRRRIFG